MNTWVVGNAPIGHHQQNYVEAAKKEGSLTEVGAKTFFMKARIMAGQADLKNNKFGLTDFKWLAKEEIRNEVGSKYWKSVKDMLAER
jgi:large subunit ribosomal protein L46